MTDSDCFVPVPESILQKLKDRGDTYIAYSTFGSFDHLPKIRKTTDCTDKFDSIANRIDLFVVDQTIQGAKLGQRYYDIPDRDMYGIDRTYVDIPLGIIKLPKELLGNDLVCFKSLHADRPETLHFNCLKLKFNEDSTFVM